MHNVWNPAAAICCTIITDMVFDYCSALTAGKRLLEAAVSEHNTWDSAAAMKSIRFTDQKAAKVSINMRQAAKLHMFLSS